jgi:hypothetical protein
VLVREYFLELISKTITGVKKHNNNHSTHHQPGKQASQLLLNSERRQ